MPFIGTNLFLGNNLIGQSYLGNNRVEASPFPLPVAGIVTNGLVGYFDATDTNSYPGTGTNWFNLVAGQPITASLVNGVTFSGGYLQTNGTNQYISIPATSLDFRSGTSTIMGATRYADTTGNGRMMSSQSPTNWLLGHYQNTTINWYAEGTIYLNNGPNDTNWRIYAGATSTGATTYNFYVNGSPYSGGGVGSSGVYGMEIGRQYNGTEYSSGSVAFVMFYNRVLSDSEVLQNYNVLKSKVGL